MTEQDTAVRAQTSKILYSPGSYMPKEIEKYGYQASKPSRKTLITYQTFSSPGIISSPCTVQVEDGSNHVVAETDTLYDRGTTVCGTTGTPNVTAVSCMGATHDEKNHSATSITSRGIGSICLRILS